MSPVMVKTLGERLQSMLIYLVIIFFISLLGFYIYSWIWLSGSGSFSTAIGLFLIGLTTVAVFFFSQALGEKKLDAENLLIVIVLVAITFAFFYFKSYLGLGSIIPFSIGGLP